jgi:hypothetical protein
MAEAHQRAELAQAGVGGRGRSRGADPQPSGRPQHEYRVANGLGGRDQQQLPGVSRQGREAPPETVLDPP